MLEPAKSAGLADEFASPVLNSLGFEFGYSQRMGTTCMLWRPNAISKHRALFADFAALSADGCTRVVIQTDFKGGRDFAALFELANCTARAYPGTSTPQVRSSSNSSLARPTPI